MFSVSFNAGYYDLDDGGHGERHIYTVCCKNIYTLKVGYLYHTKE